SATRRCSSMGAMATFASIRWSATCAMPASTRFSKVPTRSCGSSSRGACWRRRTSTSRAEHGLEEEMADSIHVRELATACGRRFGVATLTAPESLNALTLAMVDVLQTQLTRWATDPEVVGVLLDGEGDKA